MEVGASSRIYRRFLHCSHSMRMNVKHDRLCGSKLLYAKARMEARYELG